MIIKPLKLIPLCDLNCPLIPLKLGLLYQSLTINYFKLKLTILQLQPIIHRGSISQSGGPASLNTNSSAPALPLHPPPQSPKGNQSFNNFNHPPNPPPTSRPSLSLPPPTASRENLVKQKSTDSSTTPT